MIKKFFTDESLTTLVDEIKSYTDTNISDLSDGFSGVIYQMYGEDLTDDGAPTIREIANSEADSSLASAKSYTDTKTSALQTALNAKVPTSRTINGKALSADITLSASDVGAAASSHSHNDKYYTESEIDAKFDAIIGEGASETLDTIGEISAAITDNQDMLDTLNSAIGNKANVSDLSSHTGNTTAHITATERTNWNTAKTHADSAHAPSNAQKNQNAFGMITCGDVDHMATNETSSFEVLGDGIGVAVGTGKHADIAITLSNTGVLGVKGGSESSYRKGNVNITAANIGLGNVENKSSSTIRGELTKSNVTTALGYTPPTQDTATTSASGLMSATDKSKLDGIEDGANKYTLPTASSSTLGGVKVGSNISVSSGTISLTKDNVVAALGYTPPTSDTNTDTKVTNTLSTTTKAYVTGTSTATTNTGTQVFDTGVYLDTTAGRLRVTSLNIGDGAVLSLDSTSDAIKITFI